MTMQTIPGGLWIPKPWVGAINSLVTQNSESITTTTGKFAFIFRIPKTGTLSKMAFLVAAAATPATTDCRLETVSLVDGNPTGTLYAVGANATFTPSVGWTTITLGTPPSVTAGDLVALVISATGVAISITIGDLQIQDAHFPAPARFAATWSKRSERPQMGLEYNDGTYGYVPDAYPVSAVALTSYNSGSTPDEYALKFQLPFPARCAGFWCVVDGDGDFDIVLYDSDGTSVLATQSFDKDMRFSANTGLYMGRWSATASLTLSTGYWLAIKPTTATSIALPRFTYPSTAAMAATDGGANFSEASRTDAGAWSNNTTGRPICGLLFDQFDDGLSGAGETSLAFAG